MQQKIFNDKKIIDEIYDLAAAEGMEIDDYIASLHTQCDERYNARYDGLPRDVLDELCKAKDLRIKQKRDELRYRREMSLKNDIKELLEHFPDISADDVPPEVWQEVIGGTALKYAYALYVCDLGREKDHADSVNADAASRAASPAAKGECDEAFTPEAVEEMDRNDIKRNFKNIIASVKRWKI